MSKASLEAARSLAASAGRRVDTPVRKSFVRPMVEAAGPKAPLAQIYSGGRSGTVAVKLYLALLWKCSSPPFCTDKPARAWAELLDLPDPRGNGARRIKDALRTLQAAKLIELQSQPGYPNVVTLRDESGLGGDYQLPSTAYSKAKQFSKAKQSRGDDDLRNANLYFKISKELWVRGYLQKLKGPGLVMLLILLAEKAGDGDKVWFSTEAFPLRYGISHKTRAAGTQELIDAGLLSVTPESLANRPGASTFDVERRRKVYRLKPVAQTGQRVELPSPARPPGPPRLTPIQMTPPPK
ncbi:hypothetical protein [Nocardia farcinica]|uniref:hypothetical protein n=1 Tax=Nocardia farcinica TaxID=37329 RepID=UPI002457174C|nr:hypothetical protein [Nocardia farcinica]